MTREITTKPPLGFDPNADAATQRRAIVRQLYVLAAGMLDGTFRDLKFTVRNDVKERVFLDGRVKRTSKLHIEFSIDVDEADFRRRSAAAEQEYTVQQGRTLDEEN